MGSDLNVNLGNSAKLDLRPQQSRYENLGELHQQSRDEDLGNGAKLQLGPQQSRYENLGELQQQSCDGNLGNGARLQLGTQQSHCEIWVSSVWIEWGMSIEFSGTIKIDICFLISLFPVTLKTMGSCLVCKIGSLNEELESSREIRWAGLTTFVVRTVETKKSFERLLYSTANPLFISPLSRWLKLYN